MSRVEQEKPNDIVLTMEGIRVHLNRLPDEFAEPQTTLESIRKEFGFPVDMIEEKLAAGESFFLRGFLSE